LPANHGGGFPPAYLIVWSALDEDRIFSFDRRQLDAIAHGRHDCRQGEGVKRIASGSRAQARRNSQQENKRKPGAIHFGFGFDFCAWLAAAARKLGLV
jgi:hypothetical protein